MDAKLLSALDDVMAPSIRQHHVGNRQRVRTGRQELDGFGFGPNAVASVPSGTDHAAENPPDQLIILGD